MEPFKKDSITKMVLLVKHEESSKAFGMDLYYTDDYMYFHMADKHDHVYVHVPRGFLTDGATVPKIFQSLFPVWDTYYQAAVFHDYLCEYLTIYINHIPTKITREEADRIFSRIMRHLNVSPIKRSLVSAGVVAYSHFKSIVYPSATQTKRGFEDNIRLGLDMRDMAREDQKNKTA